jgi:hypothetical protein
MRTGYELAANWLRTGCHWRGVRVRLRRCGLAFGAETAILKSSTFASDLRECAGRLVEAAATLRFASRFVASAAWADNCAADGRMSGRILTCEAEACMGRAVSRRAR